MAEGEALLPDLNLSIAEVGEAEALAPFKAPKLLAPPEALGKAGVAEAEALGAVNN